MSHEDRIQQLTDVFIEELRGPIEASLRQLLAQVMSIASQDQAAAVDAARAELERAHDEAVVRLVGQAVNDGDLRTEALRADLERAHDEAVVRLVGQAVDEGERRMEALRADLERAHDEAVVRLVGQAVHDGELRLEALRAELAGAHDEAVVHLVGQAVNDRELRLEAQLEELRREHETALAALKDELEREHEAALAQFRDASALERQAMLDEHQDQASQDREAAIHDARTAAEAQAAEALATACAERDAARATIADLTDQLAVARAQHEQLTQLAHAESAAAEQLTQGRVEERQAELACSDRLLAAIRRLDEARTLTEVLTALAEHVAEEQLRAAVLVVANGRLRGWRLSGFGEIQAADVNMQVEGAGMLGRAVATASVLSTSDLTPGDALPPFLRPPEGRVGLALPILVGGRPVALVYADDATGEERVVPSNWPEVAEVVGRHAGRCLEALTLARGNGFARPQERRSPGSPAGAAHATHLEAGAARVGPGSREHDEAQEEESARRHARLLISEIKLYNEALVEQGRREGDLLALLGDEIERARRLYEEKIPAAVRQRVNCFDEELVRTLAGGDRMLLGRIT